MKLTVPTSLADITLGVYLMYESAISHEEKVAVLLGVDIELLRRIEKPSLDSIEKLLTLIQKVEDNNYQLQPIIELNGLKMGFVPDLHRLSLGEFADLETLCKDAMAHLPDILAILYRPVIEHHKDEYKIKPYTGSENNLWPYDVTMDVVLGMLGFFLNIGLRFSHDSLQSLKGLVIPQA